jgi:hypothetical protein
MKQILLLAAGIILFSACSSNRSAANEVKRETAEKRKTPVVLGARSGDHYFHLRENNFFDYLEGKNLYAGTYTQKGDSLMLGFHNNHQPTDLTSKGLIDRQSGVLLLFSKDIAKHRRLAIIP